MPLNPNGEFIPELGDDYVVSSPSKWAASPFLDQAAKHAANVFAGVGALHPIKFMADDVLVQEYHSLGKLLFLFQCRVRGEEHFCHFTYDIPPDTAAQLALIGMWGGSEKQTQH